MTPFKSTRTRNSGKLLDVYESRNAGGSTVGENPAYPNLSNGGDSYNEPLLNHNNSGLSFKAYGNGASQLVGYLGPTVSNLRSAYQSNDSWGSWVTQNDNFITTSTGIQVWYPPRTATYKIVMESPCHHNAPSGYGLGVKLEFTFDLTKGERLFILPGQRCSPNVDANSSFGGNGGTFLVRSNGTSESNLDADLLGCTVSDVIAICGGAADADSGNSIGDGTLPGSHPSGSDLETSVNSGSGRGPQGYYVSGDGAGPSGGAGFLRAAGAHNASGTVLKHYNEYEDSTSKAFTADAFVRGGRGGKGYLDNNANEQSNSGMNGSGGFGGGGGQSSGNSYHSGAGGMMGGTENSGSETYPTNFDYNNGANRHGGGSSYIDSNATVTTQTNTSSTFGYVKFNFALGG